MAQGWEKAREVSGRVGEFASLKLDIKNAKDHLENRYRLLGRIASERLINRGESTLEGNEPAVRAVLEEISSARTQLASLENKLAEVQGKESGPDPKADS